MPDKQLSAERFLAIAAGAHALIDSIPEDKYPLGDWAAVKEELAAVPDLSLRAPGGSRVTGADAQGAIDYMSQRFGGQHFPITDPDDLAYKGGLILVSLILAYHSPRTPSGYHSEDFEESKARIEELRNSRKG